MLIRRTMPVAVLAAIFVTSYASGQSTAQSGRSRDTVKLTPLIRITGLAEVRQGEAKQLRYPNGIAVDSSGNIFVADSGNDRVLEFDRSGRLLKSIGEYGHSNTQFHYPMDIDIDERRCRLYVADAMNHRVQAISCDGKTVDVLGQGDRRTKSGLNSPHGVFVDRDGTLLVADTSNHRVVRYSSEGKVLAAWGRAGTAPGEMQFPHDIVTDSKGNVYVTDFLNHRIQKFDRSGKYLLQWGRMGKGPGEFQHPWGIAVDASGRVWVADMSNHRLQVFDANGRFRGSVGRYQKIYAGAEATPGRPAIQQIGRPVFDHPKSISFRDGILGVAHPGAQSVDLYRP